MSHDIIIHSFIRTFILYTIEVSEWSGEKKRRVSTKWKKNYESTLTNQLWEGNINTTLKITEIQRSSWPALGLIVLSCFCLIRSCMHVGCHWALSLADSRSLTGSYRNRNLENSCNHQLLYILPFRGPHLFVQMRTKTSTGIRSSNFQQNDLNGVEQHRARLALLWGRHGTISKTANGVATGIDKRVCVCWEGERLGWQLWVVEQVGHSKGFFFFINIVR